MNDAAFEKPVLSMTEVFRDAGVLYKKNFRLLMVFSLIVFIFNIPQIALDVYRQYFDISYILESFDDLGLISFLLWLVIAVVILITSYGAYILINESKKGNSIKISQAFRMSYKKFWSYIGTSIVLLLMFLSSAVTGVIIAVILLVFIFFTSFGADLQNDFIAGYIIALIPVGYFIIISFFAPISIITEEKKVPGFTISKRLIKGYFWKTAILTLGLILILLIINFALSYYHPEMYEQKIAASILIQAVIFFALPLFYCVWITLYYNLREKKAFLFDTFNSRGRVLNSLVVVAGVIMYEDEILCMKRGEAKYDYLSYKCEFPGGKVEQGESFVHALKRELIEEMEMEVSVDEGDSFIVVEHTYPDFRIELHAYVCRVTSKDFVMMEHVDYAWLTWEELLSLEWAAADLPVVYKVMALKGNIDKA